MRPGAIWSGIHNCRSGTRRAGREIGQYALVNEDDDLTRTWIGVGRGLAAISVLWIAAGFIIVLGNSGVSARDRLFQACESAGAVSGSFALAAVVVLLVTSSPPQRSRGVFVVAQCVGVVMVVCAAYAAWFALTTNSHLPLSDHSTSFAAFVGLNWSYRISGVLTAFAGAAMGALNILVARRGTRTALTAIPDLGETPSGHA